MVVRVVQIIWPVSDRALHVMSPIEILRLFQVRQYELHVQIYIVFGIKRVK